MSLPVTVKSPVIVKFPPLLKVIFSDAVSELAVLKDSLVALLLAEKLPSETAAIPAATKIASVPVDSSGAWKSILPNTSFAWISTSPVWIVKTKGVSSVVDVFLSVNPELWECVTVTSE